MKDVFRYALLAHAAPYFDGDPGDAGGTADMGGFGSSPGGAPTAGQSGVSGSGASSAVSSSTSMADALGPTSSGGFGISGPTGSSASAPAMSMGSTGSGSSSAIGTVGGGLSGFGGAFGGGNEGFGGFGDFGAEIGGPVGSVSSPTAGMTGAHSGGGSAFADFGADPIGAAPGTSFAQQYGQGVPGIPTISQINFAFDADNAQAAIGQGLGVNTSLGTALGGMPSAVAAPGIGASQAMTPEQANQAALGFLGNFGVALPGPLSEPIVAPPASTFAVDPYFTNPTPLAQIAPPAQPVDPLGIAANPVSVQAINIDQYLNPPEQQAQAQVAAPNLGFANPAAPMSLDPTSAALATAMPGNAPAQAMFSSGFAPAGHAAPASSFAAAPGQFAATPSGFAMAAQAPESVSMISAAAPPAGQASAANVSSLGITGNFAPAAPATAPVAEFNVAEMQPQNAPIAPGFATSFTSAPATAPASQAVTAAPPAPAAQEAAPPASFAQAPAAPGAPPGPSAAPAQAAPAPAAPPASAVPTVPVGGGGFAIALDPPAPAQPTSQPAQNPFGQVGSMAIQGVAGMLGSGLGTAIGGPIGGIAGGLIGTALGGQMAQAAPMTDAWADDEMGANSTSPDFEPWPIRAESDADRNMAERIEDTYLLPMFTQPGDSSGRMTPYERFIADRNNYGRRTQG